MSKWIGYYEQHRRLTRMKFSLLEIDEESELFNARGNDSCGDFIYEGTVRNRVFEAVKHYSSWNIYYSGNYNKDEKEISGFWGFYQGQENGRFKICKLKSVEISPDNRDSFDECSICLDKYLIGQKVQKLKCNHFYHAACLDSWIDSRCECPICRRGI